MRIERDISGRHARMSHGLIVHLVVSVMVLALLSFAGGIIWTGGREAYQTTSYGLPLPWLDRSVPNRIIAMRAPEPKLAFDAVSFTVDALVSMLIAVAGLRILSRKQAARRRIQNRCMCCGYSLQGLDRPRCPECGASISDEARKRLAALRTNERSASPSQGR